MFLYDYQELWELWIWMWWEGSMVWWPRLKCHQGNISLSLHPSLPLPPFLHTHTPDVDSFRTVPGVQCATHSRHSSAHSSTCSSLPTPLSYSIWNLISEMFMQENNPMRLIGGRGINLAAKYEADWEGKNKPITEKQDKALRTPLPQILPKNVFFKWLHQYFPYSTVTCFKMLMTVRCVSLCLPSALLWRGTEWPSLRIFI